MNKEKLREILENLKKGLVTDGSQSWQTSYETSDRFLVKLVLESLLEDPK